MKGAVLFILSIVLGILLLPAGFLWGVARCFWQRQFRTGLKNMDDRLLVLAKAIDKYGNVACKEWFNDLLLTPDSRHPFGNIAQTISAVVGHNLLDGTLTPLGLRVNGWLDWAFGKNHARNAAQAEINAQLLVHLPSIKQTVPL